MAAEKTSKKANTPRFSKEQLISSERFAKDSDLLEALLGDGLYLVSEVEKKIRDYKKGKVE
ncbi:MAG: hypothetical protein HFG35_12190 [Eubacterium sp.]|jgi:hypothetical protein|nr:hypothetical protein [Eubacterium sp.]